MADRRRRTGLENTFFFFVRRRSCFVFLSVSVTATYCVPGMCRLCLRVCVFVLLLCFVFTRTYIHIVCFVYVWLLLWFVSHVRTYVYTYFACCVYFLAAFCVSSHTYGHILRVVYRFLAAFVFCLTRSYHTYFVCCVPFFGFCVLCTVFWLWGDRVEVRSQYYPEQSNPLKDQYIFVYKVKITNHSSQTIQLVSRTWEIKAIEATEVRL